MKQIFDVQDGIFKLDFNLGYFKNMNALHTFFLVDLCCYEMENKHHL